MSLITCKDCKKEFSTDAKRCPHCGANQPKQAVQKRDSAWIPVIIVILIMTAPTLWSHAPELWQQILKTLPHEATLEEKYARACYKESLLELKSPSTAKFSKFNIGSDHYSLKKGKAISDKNGEYVIVQALVDSQNGFGAMIRNIVSCVINIHTERVENFEFSQNHLFIEILTESLSSNNSHNIEVRPDSD